MMKTLHDLVPLNNKTVPASQHVKLRWYSKEIEVENPSSWIDNGPKTFIAMTKPVLQYSFDSKQWFEVESYIEPLTS